MDENQTLINSDLQKAIQAVTENKSVYPEVFSDPVAAPSSIPDGDPGIMDKAVGPFPVPDLLEEIPQQDKIKIVDFSEIPSLAPELNMPPIQSPEEPKMPGLSPVPDGPDMSDVLGLPDMSNLGNVSKQESHDISNLSNAPEQESHGMQKVRELALRDLAPLLDRIEMQPSQKFRIYRDILEELHDYTVIEPAYQVAKSLSNEKERGEALLYIIELIDRI